MVVVVARGVFDRRVGEGSMREDAPHVCMCVGTVVVNVPSFLYWDTAGEGMRGGVDAQYVSVDVFCMERVTSGLCLGIAFVSRGGFA